MLLLNIDNPKCQYLVKRLYKKLLVKRPTAHMPRRSFKKSVKNYKQQKKLDASMPNPAQNDFHHAAPGSTSPPRS